MLFKEVTREQYSQNKLQLTTGQRFINFLLTGITSADRRLKRIDIFTKSAN